jgi:MFS family permease
MKKEFDSRSYRSILSEPTIKKLVLSQVFFGLSSGISGTLTAFFLIYLDGGNTSLALSHYSIYYLVSNLTFAATLGPSAILLDKIGRKKILLTGAILTAVSVFMLPLSRVWWHLLFAGAVSSIGGSFLSPAVYSIIADISVGYRREKSYSAIMATSIVPGTVGATILMIYAKLFQGVLPDTVYYGYALFAAAFLAAIGVIPIFFIKESYPRSVSPTPPQSEDKKVSAPLRHDSHITPQGDNGEDATYTVPKSLRRNRVIMKILLINVLIGAGAGFIIPIFQFYWYTVFNLPQEFVFFISTLGDLGMAGGSLLAPSLARRVARTGGRVTTIVVCQAASIACAGVLSVVPWFSNLWLAIFSYVARQDLMNMINPLTQAMLMDHTPENRRGAMNSVTTLLFGGPNSISDLVSANIITTSPFPFGWAYSFFALIALYTAATGLYFTTRKQDKAVLRAQGR